MKQSLIVPFDRTLIDRVKNNVIIKIDDITLLTNLYEYTKINDKVIAVILDFRVHNVAEIIHFMPDFIIPTYVWCYFDGDKYKLITSVHNTSESNITYLIESSSKDIVIALKILSSLGINSGILMEDDKFVNSDDLIELAYYHYLAPICHAPIEPFGYIGDEIKKHSRFVDIKSFYFDDVSKFLYINRDEKISLNNAEQVKGNHIVSNLEEMDKIDYSEIIYTQKENRFYKHFSESTMCMSCPAMKICGGFFEKRIEECAKTMNEIYNLIN